MNRQTAKYRDFVLLALFAAIILLLAFTPIGYIQLPIIKATIVHVPVILGAIILGPKKGAILGVLFGLTLSQFFADGEDRLALTADQRSMLDKWNCLSPGQQKALLTFMDSMMDK